MKTAITTKPALKPAREERFRQQRERLIDAAADVIGEVGYRDASIVKIAERAKIAYGTFYRHFETQQDMFETVLPEKGREVLKYIGRQVAGAANPIEMEKAGLLAFQDYIMKNPSFFRLLSEGRVMAPDAHAKHMANLLRAYIGAMRRWRDEGYFQKLDDDGIRAIAMILIGARDYLLMDSWGSEKAITPLPDSAIDAYLDLIRGIV